LKKLYIYIVLLIFSSRADAYIDTLELRVANFFPQGHIFKERYGSFNPSYQIENTLKGIIIFNHVKWFTNFSYLHDKGYTDSTHNRSTLNLYSASTGLKYVFFLPLNFEINLGAGAVYSWLQEKGKVYSSPFTSNLDGLGGIFKFDITSQLGFMTLSAFTDYLLQPLKNHSSGETRNVNINGLYLGVGVGFRL